MIAEKMGKTEEECEDVYYMGLLHDLGKIGVPNEIINSPTKLTDEQYDVIKTHPGLGYDILSEIKSRPDLVTGARWHHERYDGKGYPDGKSGEDIPLMARIIAVADSYDAMTSNRSYRNYLPQETVRSEIEKNMGTQFDPDIAKCMLSVIDEDTNYELHE
jgi:HD-GYP domain-containing protein (c-di-GMP phosphodiesterase class II)